MRMEFSRPVRLGRTAQSKGLGEALAWITAYASWVTVLRLLVLTFVTYFVMTGAAAHNAKFEDISEAFGSNELTLVGLSVAIATLTFAAEAIGIAIVFNAPVTAVLEADLDFDVGLDMIRPGWLVLGAGLAVSALNFVCARVVKAKPPRQRPAARKEPAGEPARAAAG